MALGISIPVFFRRGSIDYRDGVYIIEYHHFDLYIGRSWSVTINLGPVQISRYAQSMHCLALRVQVPEVPI